MIILDGCPSLSPFFPLLVRTAKLPSIRGVANDVANSGHHTRRRKRGCLFLFPTTLSSLRLFLNPSLPGSVGRCQPFRGGRASSSLSLLTSNSKLLHWTHSFTSFSGWSQRPVHCHPQTPSVDLPSHHRRSDAEQEQSCMVADVKMEKGNEVWTRFKSGPV